MIALRWIRHILSNIIRKIYHSYLRLLGVKIGNNTMISLGAKIDVRRGKVTIGNNVIITHGVVILSHDQTAILMGQNNHEKHTIIHDNVFIGVNSVILAGVRIGKNSIIGSGTIVTKDVPPLSLVVGNPGKIIKKLEPFSIVLGQTEASTY
jgi:acetyltransferase-like isoleucine patch superfamily enzyme